MPGHDAPHAVDRPQVFASTLSNLALHVSVAHTTPQCPGPGEVIRPVVDPDLEILPSLVDGAGVDEPDRAVPGVDRCAERQSGEQCDPGCRAVVWALGLPPPATVRHPERPGAIAVVPEPPPRWSLEQRLEHHLLVVPAKHEIEACGRMESRDPVLRGERVRAGPVDEVAQAEHPAVLGPPELVERPAKGREMPVHVPDDEVAAGLGAPELHAESRVGRGEAVPLGGAGDINNRRPSAASSSDSGSGQINPARSARRT